MKALYSLLLSVLSLLMCPLISQGAEQFSKCTGYGDTFEFAGAYADTAEVNSLLTHLYSSHICTVLSVHIIHT